MNDENFAVFESIGEDWEQYSNWMSEDDVINFLQTMNKLYVDRNFCILQKYTGETDVL